MSSKPTLWEMLKVLQIQSQQRLPKLFFIEVVPLLIPTSSLYDSVHNSLLHQQSIQHLNFWYLYVRNNLNVLSTGIFLIMKLNIFSHIKRDVFVYVLFIHVLSHLSLKMLVFCWFLGVLFLILTLCIYDISCSFFFQVVIYILNFL